MLSNVGMVRTGETVNNACKRNPIHGTLSVQGTGKICPNIHVLK
uniref:Uncharacterized protein n=1 Tax=Setaria italica TaxID=4555 RepID=K3XTM8_SETIT